MFPAQMGIVRRDGINKQRAFRGTTPRHTFPLIETIASRQALNGKLDFSLIMEVGASAMLGIRNGRHDLQSSADITIGVVVSPPLTLSKSRCPSTYRIERAQ